MTIHWSGERGRLWRQEMRPLEAMLEPVNDPLIEALDLPEARVIADIGCGGGATSLAVLKSAPSGTRVSGFDISPDLVDAATERAQALQADITFRIANAQSFMPEKHAFDRLVSRFGIMFFEDELAAFRNLAQWLAPDGQFAFAVWAAPKANPWMSEIRRVVSKFIDLPDADPAAPGPFRYQDAYSFAQLLSKAGFRDIRCETWSGLLPIGGGLNAADAAEFALSAFSIGQELIAQSPSDFTTAKSHLSLRFASDEMDGIVKMPAAAHIVTGLGAQT